MKHLNYDELYQLAETSVNQDGFDDIQIEQLEHLKTCKECYGSFCLLSALSDVMSESGRYMFSRKKASSFVYDAAEVLKKMILVKFQVIRNVATNPLGVVLEQIDQATSPLQFGPSLAMATRGSQSSTSKVIRLEEFEDDKTYVTFNPETNELKIQIGVREMNIDDIHVYLLFDDLTKLEMPIAKRGNIVKGSMGNIPPGNFQIVIEAE